MSEYSLSVCPENSAIDCDTRKSSCKTCGWFPIVCYMRKEAIRKKLREKLALAGVKK